MTYTYTQLYDAARVMVASTGTDERFDAVFPSAIDYAEQRIYRELNLLQTVRRKTNKALSTGSRDGTIDSSFIVVNGINIFTPASSGANGTRKPLVPVSRDMLDALWPGTAVTGEPVMFSMIDQWSIAVGPAANGAYTMEVIGTYRPTPLSESNTTTFLGTYLPDLLMAAVMIFLSGYMRNFGAQASDPQQAMSWEQQYQTLFGSAETEEARKHFWASSWSSLPNSPDAQPSRG